MHNGVRNGTLAHTLAEPRYIDALGLSDHSSGHLSPKNVHRVIKNHLALEKRPQILAESPSIYHSAPITSSCPKHVAIKEAPRCGPLSLPPRLDVCKWHHLCHQIASPDEDGTGMPAGQKSSSKLLFRQLPSTL